MNNRVIRISAFILSAFLIFYVGIQIAGMTKNGYETQVVYAQSVSHSISIQGVFVREETTIPIEAAGGVVVPNYSVGTKVAINTELGSIYSDESALRAQYRAQNIRTTISALEKAQESVTGNDVIKPETLNGQIVTAAAQLIAARDEMDLADLTAVRTSLTEAMAKRAIVMDGVTDYASRITALKEDLAALEQTTSSQIHTFSSTASGYFVDHIDGLEQTMTQEYLDSMDAADLQEWLAGYTGYQADQNAVKIVTSHRWIFAAVLNEEQMQTLSNTGTVTLRFPGMKDDVKAQIADSERDTETGLYKVELEGDLVSETLLSSRVMTAEIFIREYTGIKVPKEAIRFQDEQMGVYVQTGNKIYFRLLDPIYETTDYVLSRIFESTEEDSGSYVGMYDTIVVKGKGLYDDMLVQ